MFNARGSVVSLDATFPVPPAGPIKSARKTKAGDVHTEAVEVAIVENEVVYVDAGCNDAEHERTRVWVTAPISASPCNRSHS